MELEAFILNIFFSTTFCKKKKNKLYRNLEDNKSFVWFFPFVLVLQQFSSRL